MEDAFLPTNEVLKKHFMFYYFSRSSSPVKVFVPPYTGSAISIIENGKTRKQGKGLYIEACPGNFEFLIHVSETNLIETVVDANVTVMMAEMFPLGINQFISCSLCDLFDKNKTFFPFPMEEHTLRGLKKEWLECNTAEEKINLMEKFFLRRYRPFQNLIISAFLKHISNLEDSKTIASVCREIGTTERTLNRLSAKDLGISPVQLKRIYQFRQSLNLKMQNSELSINQLAVESNYFDHSYLIKMYKRFTGLQPKKLFDVIKDRNIEERFLFTVIQEKLSQKYNSAKCV